MNEYHIVCKATGREFCVIQARDRVQARRVLKDRLWRRPVPGFPDEVKAYFLNTF